MNVLDENIIHSQRDKLRQWRIPFRQIGAEMGHVGVPDAEIIPLLLRLKKPTFFTRDFDFFRAELRHPRYCLAWLNVRPDLAAFYVRRFLRHRNFHTHEQRLGKVIRIHFEGLEYWQPGESGACSVQWLV